MLLGGRDLQWMVFSDQPSLAFPCLADVTFVALVIRHIEYAVRSII